MIKKNGKVLVSITLVLISLLAVIGLLWFKNKDFLAKTPSDPHLAFLDEVFDTIERNYWEKTDQEQLTGLFILATEKATGKTQTLAQSNKKEFLKLIANNLKEMDEEEKKKELVTQITDITLANLKPFGRSRLYTQKEETTLSQNVNNITGTDYYQILKIKKDASKKDVAQAYQEQKQQLEKSQAQEDQEKLKQVNKAYEILTEPESKELYDQAGIEPTMSSRLLAPQILYLKITKFSPTTLEELQRLAKKADQGNQLNTLVLDLRDNIGGAIDGLPYFLGPFIGPNQYAYQFFHQGEIEDYKTKTGWLTTLVRYKKVVILINENTQSSAEVMAATLKKYNVGVILGKTSKGWGTVERVFPLKNQLTKEEKFSIFLVHSLTLREDGKPIEGKGVEPTISLENPDWEQQLLDYYPLPLLISSIKQII